MTPQMIIALAITVLMVVLILIDKMPFGVPSLLACFLLVVFGVADIKTAFGGFSNSTIVMMASFMAVMVGMEKTSVLLKFKRSILNIASRGGFKSYLLIILVVMLVCSMFGSGTTAYYVFTIGFLATLPDNRALPPSKILMPAGFASNHPLIPINVAFQYGVTLVVLESVGVFTGVSYVKFMVVNFFFSLGFFLNCVIQYPLLPDHPIPPVAEEVQTEDEKPILSRNKEIFTCVCFVIAVVGMMANSYIGEAGYAVAGLSAGALMFGGVIDFKEVRNAISSPIIIMSAAVVGIAETLNAVGLITLVGDAAAGMLGSDIHPFILIFGFCILTTILTTTTGSTMGTIFVLAPLAISTCIQMGLDPTAAAVAVVVAGDGGHFLPLDGMPAMVMGMGGYTLKEFWKFTVPQYFLRLLALSLGTYLMFPM